MGHKWSTGYDTLKSNVSQEWIVCLHLLYLKSELMNWGDFFPGDSDAIIFDLTDISLNIFTF